MSDIKMSDVFHLPMECASSKDLTGIQCTELADNDFFLADFRGENSLEEANEMAEAAAHAINAYDALVEQNKALRAALQDIVDNSTSVGGWSEVKTSYVYEAHKALAETDKE